MYSRAINNNTIDTPPRDKEKAMHFIGVCLFTTLFIRSLLSLSRYNHRRYHTSYNVSTDLLIVFFVIFFSLLSKLLNVVRADPYHPWLLSPVILFFCNHSYFRVRSLTTKVLGGEECDHFVFYSQRNSQTNHPWDTFSPIDDNDQYLEHWPWALSIPFILSSTSVTSCRLREPLTRRLAGLMICFTFSEIRILSSGTFPFLLLAQ